MSQSMLNYILGGVLTLNTGILLFLLKDYLTFRFTLERELEKSFMKRTECKIVHTNTDKILNEIKEDIKEIKDYIYKENNK